MGSICLKGRLFTHAEVVRGAKEATGASRVWEGIWNTEENFEFYKWLVFHIFNEKNIYLYLYLGK